MFDNICVIGCGLIGSSIVRAIEKKKLTKKLVYLINQKRFYLI